MAEDTGVTAYASLGADLNKRKGEVTPETKEGVVSEKLPELKLSMSDSDIISLTDKWEKVWKESPKKQEWEKNIAENEKYWLGKHYDLPKLADSRPRVDNLIFESLETYLPQMTRRNPEPLVMLANSERDGDVEDPTKIAYVQKVKGDLADLADKNKMRLKLKKVGRHWAIYELGVAKLGWDLDNDIPAVRAVRPKRIILDPDATIDEDGYTGNRIGEYRKMESDRLIDIVKGDDDASVKAVAKIEEITKGELGTEVQFVEWWTPQFLVWKMGDTILLKKKNPHWNYDKTETPESDNIGAEGVEVDEFGGVKTNPVETSGINHFPIPKMPYVFLSVFNLGDQPMDKTSLIGQNLANQDKINKRNRQIDKNADRMNGGMVVSLARSGLTSTQAKGVTEALRKGGVVVIPDGAPRDAIDQYTPNGLPNDVYNDLVDTRNRLRDIFGTSGLTPSGIENEKTVRGKIVVRGLDADRIGGGVSEYLEQFADDVYNWFVQLLYVYDSGYQFIGGAVPPKIIVSVKEGSLLPKDSLTIANQAIELGSANKMSLIDMYKRLEYPNPEELAANVWLEANAPQLLYANNPLVQQALQMQQEAAVIATGGTPPAKTEEVVKESPVEQASQDIINEVPIQ